ncbi:MAG: hypothetical protein AAFO69_08825 [Bacteroidota bacterium]
MKRLLTLTLLMAAITFGATAQQKIKYSDLEGKTWKLTIDITEELEEEADNADNFFERLVIKGVSGLVENILDNIEIYFEFEKNHDLRVTVYAMGEKEVEYTEWWIDDDGALRIDDSDSFSSDQDSRWYMFDDVIVAMNEHKRKLKDSDIYLVEVSR